MTKLVVKSDRQLMTYTTFLNRFLWYHILAYALDEGSEILCIYGIFISIKIMKRKGSNGKRNFEALQNYFGVLYP